MERRTAMWNTRLVELLTAPLFVPGNRPDRVVKAAARGARAIVIDLEDAVLPDRKADARQGTVQDLAERAPDVAYLVRVNAASEPDVFDEDLIALAEVLPSVDAVVLPKATSADDVRALADRLPGHVPIIPTIENALGVHQAWAIAAAGPRVHSLLFGSVDLSANLGVTATPDGTELATARSLVVLACAAAGVASPLDGPYLNIDDPDGLRVATLAARRLGFGGKVVIHPDQLGPVTASFAPTAEEVGWAEGVLAAYDAARADGDGVVRTADGTFVDVPVAEQARTILRVAAAAGVRS